MNIGVFNTAETRSGGEESSVKHNLRPEKTQYQYNIDLSDGYTFPTLCQRENMSPFSFLQTPQLQRPEQQLHGGLVDGLCHLLIHRLWRRGASYLLWSQHLSPHWDNGGTEDFIVSYTTCGSQISSDSD